MLFEVDTLTTGVVTECPAEELVVGDIVSIQFGEKVPADLRIIQSSNLKVLNVDITKQHSRTYLRTCSGGQLKFDRRSRAVVSHS